MNFLEYINIYNSIKQDLDPYFISNPKLPLTLREIVSDAGITDDHQLINEYKLIAEKSSKLSKRQRDAVVKLVNNRIKK